MVCHVWLTAQGPACFASNISAYDADFPQELIDTYSITEVGRRILDTITNPGIPVSEDCLTLNVWTKPQTGEKRKAVMVYIHGGSFVSGRPSSPNQPLRHTSNTSQEAQPCRHTTGSFSPTKRTSS
jgi:acetyl esterase/lipase